MEFEFSKLALQAFFMLAENLAPVLVEAGVKAIKEKINNKSFDKAVDVLNALVTSNVTAAELSLKNEALIALEDGKIEKSELKTISSIVKENVLKQLNDDVKKIIIDNVDDFQEFLTQKIESTVDIVKKNATQEGYLDIDKIFEEGLKNLKNIE